MARKTYAPKPGGEPKQGLRPSKKTGKVQPNVGAEKFPNAKRQKMTRKPVGR